MEEYPNTLAGYREVTRLLKRELKLAEAVLPVLAELEATTEPAETEGTP